MSEKLKLIDKAINEANGLWCSSYPLLFVSGELNVTYPKHTKFTYGAKGTESDGFWDLVCTVDEYIQRAKELGWVNGYKYGVEYPTYGKKPDLPDDLLINVKYGGTWQDWGDDCNHMAAWYWDGSEAFRIVDKRYKPVSEIPEKQQNVSDLPDNKQNTGNVSDNSWYERGEFPPFGAECEVSNCDNKFEWCRVNYMGSHLCVVDHKTHYDQHYYLDSVKFRPIKTEREKFVDAALELYDDNTQVWLDAMFNAGFKAPGIKDA